MQPPPSAHCFAGGARAAAVDASLVAGTKAVGAGAGGQRAAARGDVADAGRGAVGVTETLDALADAVADAGPTAGRGSARGVAGDALETEVFGAGVVVVEVGALGGGAAGS